MKTSVIIPTFRRPAFLPDALASVRQQNFPAGDYEIVIVDNAAEPKSELKILSDPSGNPPLFYIHEPRNGLHNARHTGAKLATGEILIYVDDDVIAPSGWLKALLEPFQDPQVACVGGRILPHYDEEPPEWLIQFAGFLSLLDRGDEVKELCWPEDIYGCNFSVRKSVLFDVGGFNPDGFGDETLKWHRGDGETGLLKKVYEAGWKVVYSPFAWLYHRVPAKRLTEDYIKRRYFSQGLSDSYAHIRENKPGKIMLGYQVCRSIFHAIRAFWRSLDKKSSQSVKFRVRSHYWYARAEHSFRVIFNSSLYKHIMRPSYLDKDLL